MPIYQVSCYSPPSALKIEQGNTVKVEGWMSKRNIRAETIENITKGGPSCRCGTPKVVAKRFIIPRPEWVIKTGFVRHITVTTEGIQFELETP